MRKEIKKREYATRNDYYCRLMRSKDRILDISDISTFDTKQL